MMPPRAHGLVLVALGVWTLALRMAYPTPAPMPPTTTTTERTTMATPPYGYDLPSTVAALVAQVDGCDPTPVVVTTTGTAPTALELVPDRRGQAALVVALTLSGGPTSLEWRVTPTIQGVELSEGVLPALAIAGTDPDEDGLLVPIVVPAQAPLRLLLTALPGEAPAPVVFTATAQLLYGSDAAIRHVVQQFGGQAGWWSLYDETGAASRSVTLTVQRGGSPRYLRREQGVGNVPTIDLALDGRRLTVPAISLTSLRPGAALPHQVEAGQVYAATFNNPAAGSGYWAWHGARR